MWYLGSTSVHVRNRLSRGRATLKGLSRFVKGVDPRIVVERKVTSRGGLHWLH